MWNKVAELERSDILSDDPGNPALDRVKLSSVRQQSVCSWSVAYEQTDWRRAYLIGN